LPYKITNAGQSIKSALGYCTDWDEAHDYLYGFRQFFGHYTEKEIKAFSLPDLNSPSWYRAHPETVMGKIISEITKSIENLNNK
jgi:hypothetical protein